MKQTLLIADDESEIREILQLMFEEDFDLLFAKDGEEVIAQIRHYPALIILDMHLPGKTGIEICQHLATLDGDKRPPVIAISGDTSDGLVKEAYELGVSDYIGKPFDIVTLHERVLRFLRDIKAVKELQRKDKEIETVAQTAMKQAASYGRALELVAVLNDCNTPEEIMRAVAKNMMSQDLKIAIQLRSDTETYNYDADTEECSAIELQVFEVLKGHGRIYHFGRRTIFNDNHVSILFKNMPLEGTFLFDAILDVAAKLILAVNSRFLSILQNQSLLDTRDKLSAALDMVAKGISSIEEERRELIEQIGLKIGLSFHQLDMTEEQEQFFTKLVETEIRSKETSSGLTQLQALISECVEEMMLAEESETESKTDEQPADANNDIELF